MPKNVAISSARRLAGPAALIATAGGLATVALHDTHWIEWGLLGFSGMVALAGVGLARRSMIAQVLSRATAWTVLAPSALVTLVSMSNSSHVEWGAVALTAGAGSALLLSRPMLNTAEAHEQFAPSSFRRWLLTSTTAAAGAGIMTGIFGLDTFHWHPTTAVPLLMLATALLGSALGVLRMRAWGILLGALTSVVTLVAAAFLHDAAGLALALAAIPGFMMLLPVLIAKRERARADAASSSFTRVASHVSYDDTPVRVRVASGTSDDAFGDDEDDARPAAPLPAARAQA